MDVFGRIEYDAYRTDLEELNMGPRDAITMPKIEQAQALYQTHRQKYERMRDDLSIKLKLLEENRVRDRKKTYLFRACRVFLCDYVVCMIAMCVCFLPLTPSSRVCLQVKVLQKQLILLHSAVAAYYAGNQQKLNQTLRQLHSKLRTPPDSGLQSWLEES